MKKNVLEDMVTKMVLPILDNYEFELVDLEYTKEGPHFYLKVFIDKPGGITIDDCQKVSEQLSELLDEKDPIDDNYFLEVSSPGLDRPLKKDKDLEKSIGKDIEISLYKQVDGKKKYIGRLTKFDEKSILISDEKENIIEIDREIISKINLAIKF
ncbi:ribosome maturation factor RimP [Proteiniborus ethanoligenes]|uniref:Ribosome maturation factor RimP n=1 Tax=Proteiniborus ethanoligenes TaxID=415015 RepID=A0A1H3N680_9FIRM|nr:ribosome maturation factor RimP [Proteiniborus ethanoligenes]SDY84461.1 ribosome maturation factor RimP [Proteiniborus ethanoligenes]